MKKVIISISLILSFVYVQSQLTVDSTGKVAINKLSAEHTLDVFGTFRIDNWTDVILDYNYQYYGQPALYPENSWYLRLGTPENVLGDIFATHIFCHWVSESAKEEQKDEVTILENPLEKIMKINGVRYIYTHEHLKHMPEQVQLEYNRPQIGFLAENIIKEYPELIEFNKETGESYISYTRMVPVLLEAIKQQQKQLGTLKEIIASQEKDIIKLKNGINSNGNKSEIFDKLNELTEEAILFDNAPNPFNKKTVIKYFIPEAASSASLLICDLQGKEILSHKIQERNLGSITLNSSELYSGMYIYTLVVDNLIVDNKRMILTKK